MPISRRDFLKASFAVATAVALPSTSLSAQPAAVLQKKIPSSGESIPIIDIGTARRY
jgi:anaerobic selenocysteine-containing dehydrogenase